MIPIMQQAADQLSVISYCCRAPVAVEPDAFANQQVFDLSCLNFIIVIVIIYSYSYHYCMIIIIFIIIYAVNVHSALIL